MNMVSLPYPFYQTKNLTYPPSTSAWYPNYSSHQQQMNHHLLNGAPAPLTSTGLETESAPFYSHPMLPPHHPSTSPDWAHDSYNTLPSSAAAAAAAAANQQFFTNGMTTPSSIHMSPSSINNQTHTNANLNSNISDNLQNNVGSIPPSPPITVNSACSEISSPGISSNGNGTGVISNGGDASPNMLNRPKSGYDWMKKQSYQTQPTAGKTRTKDKYRVVYTDFQRLELEKEYHMSHYITIRRKAELAVSLTLSERQVKIWFQNRRAKDRKQTKKRDGPVPSGMGNGMLSNGSANLSLALQHHNMGAGPSGLGTSSMYGSLDIKPKLEPGLLSHHNHHHHHAHNYGHLHQAHAAAAHAAHPMHHLSTMGMNLLHQSHMAHHSAASVLQTPISSAPTSIQSHLSS